jgi:predicted nucleic acid-binding protein
MTAAKLGVELRLPLADSVVLATARLGDATLWTQDADFANIPGVKFRPKTAPNIEGRRLD